MPAHIALLRSMVINRQRLTSAKARLMAEQAGTTDIVTIGVTVTAYELRRATFDA